MFVQLPIFNFDDDEHNFHKLADYIEVLLHEIWHKTLGDALRSSKSEVIVLEHQQEYAHQIMETLS